MYFPNDSAAEELIVLDLHKITALTGATKLTGQREDTTTPV